MLVITRHRAGDEFLAAAEEALAALAVRPGCRGARVARAIDDPQVYVLVTEWDDVGSYRRALSNFDVKVAAVPVLASAMDEESAFEVLAAAEADGVRRFDSDRAPDADTAGPL